MKATAFKWLAILSVFNYTICTFGGAWYVSHPGNTSNMLFSLALGNMVLGTVFFIAWLKTRKPTIQ